MDEDGSTSLRRLFDACLRNVRFTAPETREADYDEVIARVVRRARVLSKTVARNRARVENRYTDLVDKPRGRQETVLANSSLATLLALAYALMRESFSYRFDDPARSLALASLAHEAAQAAAREDDLAPTLAADLIGESLGYLANALRLNSDLHGSEGVLADAGRQLDQGTGDRAIRADYMSFLASLRYAQGKASQAAEIWERESTIRRLLKDPNKLGLALLNCGLARCWIGDVLRASDFIREGAELVDEDRMAFLGLLHLAEAFSRSGDGMHAWKLLCTGDLIAGMTELGDGLTRHQRWTKGHTYRALGELANAERTLTEVRDEYIENREPLRAAFVALDLLAVLAARGKHSEVVVLAESTQRILLAEGLEQKALGAFMMLHRAAQASKLTEQFAVRVGNFIMRSHHNREARFE